MVNSPVLLQEGTFQEVHMDDSHKARWVHINPPCQTASPSCMPYIGYFHLSNSNER